MESGNGPWTGVEWDGLGFSMQVMQRPLDNPIIIYIIYTFRDYYFTLAMPKIINWCRHSSAGSWLTWKIGGDKLLVGGRGPSPLRDHIIVCLCGCNQENWKQKHCCAWNLWICEGHVNFMVFLFRTRSTLWFYIYIYWKLMWWWFFASNVL